MSYLQQNIILCSFSKFWIKWNNIDSILKSTLPPLLLTVYLLSTSIRNQAGSYSGIALSGNNFASNNSSGDLAFVGIAQRDKAVNSQGPSMAISGNNVIVANATGNIDIDTSSFRNDATSQAALSGTRFHVIDNGFTNVVFKDESSRNSISGEGVSGSRLAVFQGATQGSSVGSNFQIDQVATRNDASGNEGNLLSGISTEVEDLLFGSANITAHSNLNDVKIGNETDIAISGVQVSQMINAFSNGSHNLVSTNNEVVGQGKNTTNAVAGVQLNQGLLASTNLNSTAEARDNIVDIDEGNAVAGIQNNLYRVFDAYNQGPPQVNITSTATNNVAKTANNAVAGVQSNILQVADSHIDLNSVAMDNKAYSSEGMAIGGLQNNFREVSNSNVSAQNTAMDNYAFSGNTNGIAVAGVQTNMERVVDSLVTVDNVAMYNKANAPDGSAVAGVESNLDVVQGSSQVVINNLVGFNEAIGSTDAVVQAVSNVGTGSQLVTTNTQTTP
eukprot:TRINITY_DN1201_c0_g1_i6.p1 TRINITY_DN1201_c0_g1~~TRINITY_DN1201_c0_g1_i6.p1  ORF type:complete len:501 (+),score=69.49 TRINITY_DN1201_c0_g1_i6:751-2253(+)